MPTMDQYAAAMAKDSGNQQAGASPQKRGNDIAGAYQQNQPCASCGQSSGVKTVDPNTYVSGDYSQSAKGDFGPAQEACPDCGSGGGNPIEGLLGSVGGLA